LAPPAPTSAMKVKNPTTNTLYMDVGSSFIDQTLQQTQILEPAQQHTSQPQQYLLATFTLFSFFNSPLMSCSSPHSPHAHTGTRGGAGVPPPGVVLGVCVNHDAVAPSAQGARHSPNECEGFCRYPTRTTTTLRSVSYHDPTLSKGVRGPSSTPHTL
jgi:hypothetical protein